MSMTYEQRQALMKVCDPSSWAVGDHIADYLKDEFGPNPPRKVRKLIDMMRIAAAVSASITELADEIYDGGKS